MSSSRSTDKEVDIEGPACASLGLGSTASPVITCRSNKCVTFKQGSYIVYTPGSAANAIQCATGKAFATSMGCDPTPLPSLTAAPLTGDLRHATACIRRWPLPCLLSLSELALPAVGVAVRCAGCPALCLRRSFLSSLGVAAGGHTDDLQAQTVWQGIFDVHRRIAQSQAQMCLRHQVASKLCGCCS